MNQEIKDDSTPQVEIQLPELPEPVEIEWPQLHRQGLGCGVEDRGLYDRYECAEYGWQDGVDRAIECVPEQIFDADQMRAYAQAALNARAGGDAKDAERWRYLRTKVGFSGNGDGTSSMFAINLPVRVAGWPEVGQHAEFIDAAIDSEIAALASQAVGVKS